MRRVVERFGFGRISRTPYLMTYILLAPRRSARASPDERASL